MKRIAISIGCPCGIGPEVAVVAAAKLAKRVRITLVGDRNAIEAAAELRKVKLAGLSVLQPGPPLAASARKPGHPTRASGAAQLAWIDAATDLVKSGDADALVTGPVSKVVIARSGAGPMAAKFLGHTEHLAERLGAREVTMAFWSEKLTTSLVTTHLAIADVPRAITPAAVARAVFWTAHFLAKIGAKGALAIASLNPHAGEGGLLGKEEARAITPGIARAKARLVKAKIRVELVGPVPAESAIRIGANGGFAGVVAMYHDQATIPMKLLGFGEAVNVSLGLPIVRTSVDHGTAYDRAGKGTADARGMLEAIALAERLV
jgi:4-hydroxythreonine-4-phosphate dehydrogenase